MQLCKRNLNAFQMCSLRMFGGMLGASVAFTSGIPALYGAHETSKTAELLLGLFAVIPIIGTMVILARYLSGEKDEYIRALVTQSLLWGFGIVMVADTIAGALIEFHPLRLPFGLLNMDLFFVASAIAVRIKLWRDQ